MKPRNRFEKIVAICNEKLSAIDPKATYWAINKLVTHPAFRTSGKKVTCGDCGHQFSYEGDAKHILCPHCRRRLQIFDTLNRTYKDSTYFSVLDTVDSLQIQRVFLLEVQFKKGKVYKYNSIEVCRLWLDSTGKKSAVTSRKRTFGCYLDSFDWSSKIELRNLTDTIMIISDTYFYPKIKIIPEVKRNGMRARFNGIHPFLLMKHILSDSRFETVAKYRDVKALQYFINYPYRIDKCWDSYKIARRHNYVPKDFVIWYDLIQLLTKCGKDILSPYYICPSNLVAEHDKWNKKIEEEKRRVTLQREMSNAKEYEDSFIENKAKFFGIVLNDKDFQISVLDSIEAFWEEGENMHHCVFSAGYYRGTDSLILSAHDYEGNRIETIEYSLTTNKVVQSRGKYNKETPLHDRIVNLVNSNAHLFIKAKESA